jgi:hypothetical protein
MNKEKSKDQYCCEACEKLILKSHKAKHERTKVHLSASMKTFKKIVIMNNRGIVCFRH